MFRFVVLALALVAGPVLAAPPAPSFTVDDVSADEQGGVVEVTVRKHGRLNKSPSSVTFWTVDGTAKAGEDFSATRVTLSFGAAETVKVVAVPLVKDTTVEANETFTARISAVSNARLYDGSAVVTITDSYVAPPSPDPEQPISEFTGETPIADNFDWQAWLEPGEQPHASPDAVGAFRFTCLAGQVLRDDPIVYPGRPGASPHWHQFFGNTATDGNSTYDSLRKTGGSTCTRSEETSPQRSAYWLPAMLDGAGNVVKPDWINTYYKQLPASDPDCAKLQDPNSNAVIPSGGKCVGLPNGIRFLMGYNMATGENDFTDPNRREYWAMGYGCSDPATGQEIAGKAQTMAALVGKCPAGNWLRAHAAFPQCWDGKNLDSPDHRAHIAFPVQSYCPPSHPYKFPEVAVSVHYRTDKNFEAGKWYLSGDEMHPSRPAGSILHFDYWEAWSPTIKELWQKNCIDGRLSCSTGNVGDGRQIKGMQQVGPYPEHVLVPISSLPD